MEKMKTALTEMLGIDYPVIMAPMFLVSNAKMVIEACKAGITGAIPAHHLCMSLSNPSAAN
jgi:nitronate monooxygenase